MHILKPLWLTHGGEKKDFEVYSCHVSPDGQRLVTAAGDGYVRIWSTEAVYNSVNADFASKPKQLASMSYHSGTIHTVRFSPGGKFLASGADDKIVCIYTHDPNPPSHNATFGSNEVPPVENWRIFRRLIGHDNDVQDLGWSYDGTILVSVGLDSKVVVWSGFTFEKLKTLSNHSSHVKGITFDPANKYFATASDDRTIRVFRFTSPTQNYTSHDAVNNFILEQTITQPFTNSPLTTYFRRCSWAPDGQLIAAANAVNGPVSAIAIINRGSWDGDTTLIGHEAPVEVCAFSPRLYGADPATKNTPDGHVAPHTTVIACGAADKCLSIWTTSSPRPLVVQQDIANKPISDIAWSPDGLALFATCLDGAILAVVFQPGELGFARPIEENDRSLSKFGTSRKGLGFPETTDALLLEEMSKAGELKGVEGRMGDLMGDSHSAATAAAGAPISTITNGVIPSESLPNGTEVSVNGEAAAQARNDQNQAKLERLKNRVEITKDGKKRIRPLLVSSAGGAESSLPQSKLVNANTNVQSMDVPQSVLDLSKPFDGLPKGGLTALLLGNKRKYAQIEGDEDGQNEKKIAAVSAKGATAIVTNGPEGLLPAQPQLPVNGQQNTPQFIRPAVINPVLSVSQLRLAVPKVRTHIVQGIDQAGKPSESNDAVGKSRAEFVFEARNPGPQSLTNRPQDREPSRITLTRKEQPLWQDFLPRTVLLVTGNQEFWAAADETGSIYLWTPYGRRLNSALVMEAQPVILTCYNSWLLCVTAVGMCYVWNIKTMASPHPPVSLAPVLDAAIHSLAAHPTGAPAITQARLNSEGRIIVSLSNGDGYAYSPQMYCWQRLSEIWWAVGSQYWNTTDTAVGAISSKSQNASDKIVNLSAGIIPWLERNTTSETLLRGRAYFLQRLIKVLLSREGYESFESGLSIAHLENRVAAALMLGAKEEFRLYLLTYAKRLGAEGLRLKVEELLRTLLGGIVEEPGQNGDTSIANPNLTEGRNWQDESKTICGWSRDELLKDVVLLLGKHRDLQRVTVPYAKLLNVMETPFSSSTILQAKRAILFNTDHMIEYFEMYSLVNIFTPPRKEYRSLTQNADCTSSSSITYVGHSSVSPDFASGSSAYFSGSPSHLKPYLGDHEEAVFHNHIKIQSRGHPVFKSLVTALLLGLAITIWRHFFLQPSFLTLLQESHIDTRAPEALVPAKVRLEERQPDPRNWLKEHANNEHAIGIHGGVNIVGKAGRFLPRPRAALISLVRNEELEGILQSMRQLEARWNHKYQYPWIFFNEKAFNEKFKAATSNATSSTTAYEIVPRAHWSTPSWIDESKYRNSLDYLGMIGVGKGWMLSYRNMCRWNSGFFYRHPALRDYDFYWRVEPEVHFFCDIDYDPFRFMHENGLVYGFNMNILDDARSFPSLWSTTRDFIIAHPDLIHPEADLDWLLDSSAGGIYNNCQFFSNFEIGDLRFFRSEANEAYFKWLDETGGFYYERFGDAPIHTLSVSMFAPKQNTWFFRDIGYQHDIARHCPPNRADRCTCEPTSLDENFYKLVPMESPQKKPGDTCIRQWLGGEWLEKKKGWSQQAERAFGGDGYSGYVMDGMS